MTTPRHGYTELPTGQNASPESMNEAFEQLEQGANLFSVLDILNATPGSPTNGQMYLVGTSPTGQWSTDGAANKIATRRGGVWAYTTPHEGDYADVADEDALYRYSGSAWGTFTIAGSVSTTGSPSSGKLAKFSGASTITNGDLTGDVTTSGGLATTLAASGVSAATYGDATHVAQVAVDAKGRITSASNVAITAYVPGGTDVAVADGGTGVSTVPTNGQLLIGNGTGYTVAGLTAGANVTITPSSGGITISSSITGGTVGDGDYGDITVTSSGTVYTIDADAVTYAKMQNVSAASKLIGRGSAGGSGDPEEITVGAGLSMSSTTISSTSRGLNLGTMRPASDFTQINISGNRTLTDTSGKAITIKETSPDTTLRIVGITRNLPSTTSRVAVFVQPNMSPQRYHGVSFGFSDGTKYHVFALFPSSNTAALGNYEQQTWSNSTTRASATALTNTGQFPATGIGFWLGLRVDNSSGKAYWEFSSDGVNYATAFVVTQSSGYLGTGGYTKGFVGLFAYNQDAGGTDYPDSISILDWDENGLSRSFG